MGRTLKVCRKGDTSEGASKERDEGQEKEGRTCTKGNKIVQDSSKEVVTKSCVNNVP